MNMFEANDAAVVTGAGNGIGRAIAQALVREGVNTLFVDINPDSVAAAVAQLGDAEGTAGTWVGDLSERRDCERLVKHAGEVLGPVTMFVHSASPPRHEVDHIFEVDDNTWRKMHAVNVDAAFYLGREFSREMVANNIPGRLLMLTSLHATTPRNLPHYSSAKGAMEMMVKEFAKSLGPYGIRANALVPGAIVAGGFVADPALARHIPLGRLGEADDLAPMALAVLSNRIGGYMTGTSIVIDGGISLTNWFDTPSVLPAIN